MLVYGKSIKNQLPTIYVYFPSTPRDMYLYFLKHIFLCLGGMRRYSASWPMPPEKSAWIHQCGRPPFVSSCGGAELRAAPCATATARWPPGRPVSEWAPRCEPGSGPRSRCTAQLPPRDGSRPLPRRYTALQTHRAPREREGEGDTGQRKREREKRGTSVMSG